MGRSVIYHIYWGTAGNAGLYLDEIYQTLTKAGYNQEVFVSYYYPFNYGHKIFFRYTELGHSIARGKLRLAIRLLELIGALTYVYVSILMKRPYVVNFSVIGQMFPIPQFLWMVKKTTKCKIILTCHDVIPFQVGNQSSKSQLEAQRKLLQLGDYLLVHNLNSINDLKEYFGVEPKKIIMHGFPIMDLRKLEPQHEKVEKTTDFLFVGHLRKEKGIEILLNAWVLFHKSVPDAKLVVAGNAPFGLDISKYENMNIEFYLHFLSDDEYFNYVESSRYVVLPYTKGTNSGIISTVLSLGANVITSDISMFQNNPLVSKDDMFIAGDSQSLAKLLEYKYSIKKTNSSRETLDGYRQRFAEELIAVYKLIFS